VAQPGGRPGDTGPRNWVHKKIPDCAVELNTQNCAWFGSQISLITAMSFRETIVTEKFISNGLIHHSRDYSKYKRVTNFLCCQSDIQTHIFKFSFLGNYDVYFVETVKFMPKKE